MSTIAMAKRTQHMYGAGYKTTKMQSCTVTQLFRPIALQLLRRLRQNSCVTVQLCILYVLYIVFCITNGPVNKSIL